MTHCYNNCNHSKMSLGASTFWWLLFAMWMQDISSRILYYNTRLIKSYQNSVSNYSELEKQCFSYKMLLHEPNGECYPPFIRGPCAKGQIFVLDEEEFVNRSGKFRSLCRPCPEVECISGIQTEICPLHGTVINYDIFGQYQCVCQLDHYRMKTPGVKDLGCYPLYDMETPCTEGFVFGLSKDGVTGECRPDRCTNYNHNSSIVKRHLYVPNRVDGKCYEYRTEKPCKTDQLTSNDIRGVPNCSDKVYFIESNLPCFNARNNLNECLKMVAVRNSNNFIKDLTHKTKVARRRTRP